MVIPTGVFYRRVKGYHLLLALFYAHPRQGIVNPRIPKLILIIISLPDFNRTGNFMIFKPKRLALLIIS